jgi:hypothetical protein
MLLEVLTVLLRIPFVVHGGRYCSFFSSHNSSASFSRSKTTPP